MTEVRMKHDHEQGAHDSLTDGAVGCPLCKPKAEAKSEEKKEEAKPESRAEVVDATVTPKPKATRRSSKAKK